MIKWGCFTQWGLLKPQHVMRCMHTPTQVLFYFFLKSPIDALHWCTNCIKFKKNIIYWLPVEIMSSDFRFSHNFQRGIAASLMSQMLRIITSVSQLSYPSFTEDKATMKLFPSQAFCLLLLHGGVLRYEGNKMQIVMLDRAWKCDENDLWIDLIDFNILKYL